MERAVEVGEVFGFDADVEFAKALGSKAEFSAGDAPGVDSLGFEVVEPGVNGVGQFEVVGSGGEVDPDIVAVHGWSLLEAGGG